jgi:hypothetical protein
LRLGTADAQTILKRFTRSNYQHPTYRAIVELWFERMTPEDFRALTPLTDAHINSYGTFEPDMQRRLHLDAA